MLVLYPFSHEPEHQHQPGMQFMYGEKRFSGRGCGCCTKLYLPNPLCMFEHTVRKMLVEQTENENGELLIRKGQ